MLYFKNVQLLNDVIISHQALMYLSVAEAKVAKRPAFQTGEDERKQNYDLKRNFFVSKGSFNVSLALKRS